MLYEGIHIRTKEDDEAPRKLWTCYLRRLDEVRARELRTFNTYGDLPSWPYRISKAKLKAKQVTPVALPATWRCSTRIDLRQPLVVTGSIRSYLEGAIRKELQEATA